MKTLITGNRAEKQALKFLRRNGLEFITSNYRSRHGEIDLVMRHEKTLVFVEVRYRVSEKYGGAAASVDFRKQQKLLRTGLAYLQSHDSNALCRFDVVAINGKGEINWIRSAFTA